MSPGWSLGQDCGPPGRQAQASGGGWPDLADPLGQPRAYLPVLARLVQPHPCPVGCSGQAHGAFLRLLALVGWAGKRLRAGEGGYRPVVISGFFLFSQVLRLRLASTPAPVFSGEALERVVGSSPCAEEGQPGLWVRRGLSAGASPPPCSPRAARICCPPRPPHKTRPSYAEHLCRPKTSQCGRHLRS